MKLHSATDDVILEVDQSRMYVVVNGLNMADFALDELWDFIASAMSQGEEDSKQRYAARNLDILYLTYANTLYIDALNKALKDDL